VGTIVTSGPGIDPEWYRTDANYHAVGGSIDHRGRERKTLDHEEILAIAHRMKEKTLLSLGSSVNFPCGIQPMSLKLGI